MVSHNPKAPRAVSFALPEISVFELLKRIGLATSILAHRPVIDEAARMSALMALAGVTIDDIVDFERWSNGDYPEPDALTLGA
ncbi:hypothetical protein RDI86_02060 [Cellulosimicrobium sp. XJ-DQ-B-000]|uniref:hypothetical protein n=1 Tax=Cellulosimicrobium sp. XJ-DQ-B-000 TaxID=3072182 RepID=UPI0028097B14|nr:hypothetical protein [Cellulosimicrobium sp. XJ-DQ-B-000]MDQ8040632.1 hypothetical protein [Cellulosimicrobium sp. XJ-DQ-B-000]